MERGTWPCFGWAVLIGVLLGLLGPGTTRADGVIVVEPPGCDPACPGPVVIAEQLSVRSHRVDVAIANGVAQTRIDQVFHNPNPWVAEGTYLFPIPDGAAIGEFAMWVDGEPITAKLLDAAEARRIYDETVRRLRDPALLEYVGGGVIQASVFPIPPGEDRRVEIGYAEVLPAEQGLTRYVYPLNTERFSATPLEQVSVRVAVEADAPIRAVYSPSHEIAVDRQDERRFTAGYEASGVTPATDFELFYSVSTDEIGANVVSHYDAAAGEGYFLLLASPGIERATTAAIAKDVVIVLDTSGSMEGEKLVQTKRALRYVLEHLNPDDRFNVIEFSTGVRVFERGLQPVARAADAVAWVERLQATGGTDINLALLDAMATIETERPTMVLFLTDGLPTEGEVEVPRILDNVAAAAPSNVRLFAFGVGDDVDTVLLDSLTADNRGRSTYVRPGQAVDEAVSTFYAGIGTPVLADVRLDVEGVQVEEVIPTELPDLFAGGQMVVLGRYRTGGTATVSLSGNVDGQPQTFVYGEQPFATGGGETFVLRLWATRRIGHLLNEIRLRGEDSELVSAIVDLSIRHGVVTPYTSYLIEEEDVLTQTGRDEIADAAIEAMVADEAPASGAGAVDRAQAQQSLADAEVAAAPRGKGPAVEQTRLVGARTFVLREGVWVETIFDPSTMEPTTVAFASDAYFRLLDERPDLAEAFALGARVIAVSEGEAFEVTG